MLVDNDSVAKNNKIYMGSRSTINSSLLFARTTNANCKLGSNVHGTTTSQLKVTRIILFTYIN